RPPSPGWPRTRSAATTPTRSRRTRTGSGTPRSATSARAASSPTPRAGGRAPRRRRRPRTSAPNPGPHPRRRPGGRAPAGAAERDWLGDTEVGDERAGRLVSDDEGVREDTEKETWAEDVGIDRGAASAEEAAVHISDGDGEGDEA